LAAVGLRGDGIALGFNDSLCGYVDTTGRPVLPLRYKNAGDFSDGVAHVEERYYKGRYIYIDKRGNEYKTEEEAKKANASARQIRF
jgi:hypothetical protein